MNCLKLSILLIQHLLLIQPYRIRTEHSQQPLSMRLRIRWSIIDVHHILFGASCTRSAVLAAAHWREGTGVILRAVVDGLHTFRQTTDAAGPVTHLLRSMATCVADGLLLLWVLSSCDMTCPAWALVSRRSLCVWTSNSVS